MAKIETKLSDQQLRVYDLIRLAGWEGKTCDEIEEITGYTHQAASARVNDLMNWPLDKPKDKKTPLIGRRGARRKTRAGRGAFVYVAAGLLEAGEREGVDD